MAGILFFFFCYWLLLEILPVIRDLIAGLIVEAFPALFKFFVWAAGKLIAMTAHLIVMAARGLWALLVFFYFLADEALHSESDPEEKEIDEEDAYESALILLGLQQDCTKKEFTCAFRSAMALAHPDKGGTDEEAMAVNAARNIIKSHKGWR